MNSERYLRLDALYRAVVEQYRDDPEFLAIPVLAAMQEIEEHDGIKPVYPEHYGRNPERAFVYIGRAACGCIHAVQVDDPRALRVTAEAVKVMIEDGLAVERVTLAYARQAFGRNCPDCARPEQKAMEL